jgi:hypothetical protein
VPLGMTGLLQTEQIGLPFESSSFTNMTTPSVRVVNYGMLARLD